MNNNVNEEIDLLAMAKELWKNILVIALVAVLCGSAAFGYTVMMIKPQYQATAAMYVNSNSLRLGEASLSITSGELSTSSNLVSVYVYILKSRTTLEAVIKETGLNYSPSALKSMISTKGVSGTAAFEVTVTSSNPAESELIANAIAKILPDRVSEIVDGSAVRIVDYAIIPSRRSGPDLMKNTAMGVLAGAAISAALVVLRFLLDEKSRALIGSVDALRALFPGLMVLSQIPDMRSDRRDYYSNYYAKDADGKKHSKSRSSSQGRSSSSDRKNPRAAAKVCEYMTYSGREAFKRLRTNLLLAFPEDSHKCKVIGITSAQISEGKSTTSINLAYSLAELGKKVLLIDADMRRPSIHEKMGMRSTPGLSEVILGTQEPGKAVANYKSSADNTFFHIIPSGAIPDNPAELLNSDKLKKLIEAVAPSCDYVIFDLPPVNAVVDAINVSKHTDGMIVVLRENCCPEYVMGDCIEQLNYAKANILGFVMNGCTEGSGKRYQYNKYYYKQYTK